MITTAQAMSHPDVALTINTLGKIADELREERYALLIKLAAAEQQASKPLTDWDIDSIRANTGEEEVDYQWAREFARAIEQAHGIKGEQA